MPDPALEYYRHIRVFLFQHLHEVSTPTFIWVEKPVKELFKQEKGCILLILVPMLDLSFKYISTKSHLTGYFFSLCSLVLFFHKLIRFIFSTLLLIRHYLQSLEGIFT